MKKNPLLRLLVLSGMVVLAAAARLLPHAPNFTPVAAMALFGGAYFAKRRDAFLIPLAAMFVSDILLMTTIYSGYGDLPDYFTSLTTGLIYLSFALTALIGIMLRNRTRLLPVVTASIAASSLFFLLTNFGVWASASVFYSRDFTGLVTCYAAALPFFRNTLLGDLFYSGLLFGIFEFATWKMPSLSLKRSG